MYESENKMMTPQDELVDVLLDFIIVSAELAKQVNQAMKTNKIKEGGKINEQDERTGYDHRRATQSRRDYH